MKVKLGKLVNVKTGKLDANASSINGAYPFFTCSKEPLKISTYSYDCECVLVAGNGDLNVKYYNGKFDAYQRTYIIEDNGCKKIYIPYLYYFMDKYVEKLRTQSIGGVIKYIKLSNITEVEIVLPNVDIQKKIVDKLDKVNAVINKKNMQLEKLDLLVRSLFIEMFGDPISNSKKWTIKRLVELSILITNGTTPSGGSENYIDSGVVFLRSQNVWKNRIDLEDTVYISSSLHKIMNKSRVIYNDILITKTGRVNTENSSLGRAAIYKEKNKEANINGHVYLIRLKDTVNPEYILSILTGEAYREYIRRVCVGGIDKRQINLNHVEDFPIIVPPLDLQKRFAEYVSSIDKSKYSSFSHLSA